MTTDDELFRLLERADPARLEDATQVVDSAGYLTALLARPTTVTLDIRPPTIDPTRRRSWTIVTVAAVAAASVATMAIAITRHRTTTSTDHPTPSVTVRGTLNAPNLTTATSAAVVTTGAAVVGDAVGWARLLEDPTIDESELASDEAVYRPGYGATEVTPARTYVSLRTCNWVAEPCSGSRGWAYVVGAAEDTTVHTGLLGVADDLVLSEVDGRRFVASGSSTSGSPGVPSAWMIDSVTGARGALTWRADPTTLTASEQALVLFPVNTQPYFRTPPAGFLPRVVDARDGTIRPLRVPDHASAVLQVQQSPSASRRIWIGTARGRRERRTLVQR